MKFGIDPPWFQDDIERTAFNLYAIECCDEEEEDEEDEDE